MWNNIFKSNPAHPDDKWAAGVWEQGRGFVPWSYHTSAKRADAAARKYARQQRRVVRTGGMLSWAGGVQSPDLIVRGVQFPGPILWVDGDGIPIRYEERS